MAYIAVFVAGMIITIVALSLLAASIRYALDHDGPHYPVCVGHSMRAFSSAAALHFCAAPALIN
jgi:hypothetical protein